ncbi:relaxase/mobilization nuclease domain-containing protein [Microbacterium sp. RG1]|uniref:relaxase/mobilization nuclease domain-containing protein n=1 Tax=Microbacterium sp. RG1 TaxID=2489212 RepID=UPI0010CA499E|nr:relaxase/mobilization nuclease domain-containing protein [Microbacterium sp. RG1]QCQ17185.1 hypothetical protein EHF32_10870 [Microbacterium sp. RG1]
MAVVVASSTRSADALINYALEDKPDQKLERYVMASGVGGLLVSVAKQQMRDVRKRWGKDKPGAFVQAYHVVQSFATDELDPDDPDAWMTAQRLGSALAEQRFPGRQALIVTQRDGATGCVHNHLVINSIDTKTGRSLDSSLITHARLVEAHEQVLAENGFEQRADLKQAFSDATERRERGEPSSLRTARSRANHELREFQRHIIWETECDIADDLGLPRNKEPFSLDLLKHRIDVTLTDPESVDWDSFVTVGRSHGVQIEQRGRGGRGISYGLLREEPNGTLAEPTASDRRRGTTLGTAFEMDAVEQALARNLRAHQSAPAILASPPTPAYSEADTYTPAPASTAMDGGEDAATTEPPFTDARPPGTTSLAELRAQQSDIEAEDATARTAADHVDGRRDDGPHLPVEPAEPAARRAKKLPLHVRFPELARVTDVDNLPEAERSLD